MASGASLVLCCWHLPTMPPKPRDLQLRRMSCSEGIFPRANALLAVAPTPDTVAPAACENWWKTIVYLA